MYRPSQRPSFRFRIFPSPFARLFGIKSTPFGNEQYRNQEGKAIQRRNSYQKVIICTSEPRRLIFVYGDAISAPPGAFSLVTAVRFSNCQEALSLTTAAQNMCNLCRKSPLHKNHFFEWWKTENFSNACGTVTLKSMPSRGSDAPHVHQRPRKHPPRCILDCGFKTSESPALRGFVGGPQALATAALYLVLKSNSFHHSENLPVKFGFSPKTVPANIAKKLLSQTLP